MRSVPAFLAICAVAILAGVVGLAITEASLGTPAFFALTGTMCAAYVAALARIWRERSAPRRALLFAVWMAVAFRVPLAVLPVDAQNDMVRYLWDGRVQRLGLNPYAVLPSDPALEYTHTDETRQMPSARTRTPYPPAAQLFFRAITSVHESTLALKLALVLCDLITMIVVWRWLALTGRSEWLVLAYAWNPLVILEVSHSGHMDVLGAMWIAIAAYSLSARRSTIASMAFVLAVATKLLPIVLAPLFWRRVRWRDLAAAAILVPLLVWPFLDGAVAVPNVIGRRFNGPVFLWIAGGTWDKTASFVASAVAVGFGFAIALWCRFRLHRDDPAAWAWPMAISLACAPVVYSWYLLYLTPFLWTTATLPLLAWNVTVLPTYIVWERVRTGGRWEVPGAVVAVEYATVVVVAVVAWVKRKGGASPAPTDKPEGGASPAPTA